MYFYKCTDCWRMYSHETVSTGEFTGCKCGGQRFKQKKESFWNKVKSWLS